VAVQIPADTQVAQAHIPDRLQQLAVLPVPVPLV